MYSLFEHSENICFKAYYLEKKNTRKGKYFKGVKFVYDPSDIAFQMIVSSYKAKS